MMATPLGSELLVPLHVKYIQKLSQVHPVSDLRGALLRLIRPLVEPR